MIDSLYVHIPFCDHICSYCDFCKLIYNDKFAFSYIDELIKEIKSYGEHKYKTIYLGGGTPSSLSTNLLEKIVSFLSNYLEEDGEFSIEVNPESVSKEKLFILKKYGINRISIGMQTSSNKYLKLLNRCDFSTFLDSYKLIKEFGFSNINVDLMYALADEKIDQVKKDLNEILKLNPTHISTYSLILEENSVFGKNGYKEASDDVQADQYEFILKTLRNHGFKRYEVSNFCLKGYVSRHNLTYWNDKEYVGVGLGASGYLNGKRYTNTKSLPIYLKGKYVDFSEEITAEDDEKYYLLTKLRLEDGFSLIEFENKFHVNFLKKYENQFKKLNNNYLLLEDNGRIKATDKGILLLDSILVDLF